MKTLAVFDFDCTLTRKDSFINFLLDTFDFSSFCKGIAVNLFPLLLSSLRLTSDDEPKERVFQHFFSGWSEEAFNSVCTKYSLAKIDGIINQEALEKVNWHRSQHHMLVIASASINMWIIPWAKRNGFIDVIATEPEIKGGTLTGRFRTKNCKGPEKLRRFLEHYPYRNQYFLYAYGDSQGDKPLLNIADKPFFRSFH
jgi:HAD superfamily hydrolase (TIGR01490 family)